MNSEEEMARQRVCETALEWGLPETSLACLTGTRHEIITAASFEVAKKLGIKREDAQIALGVGALIASVMRTID